MTNLQFSTKAAKFSPSIEACIVQTGYPRKISIISWFIMLHVRGGMQRTLIGQH